MFDARSDAMSDPRPKSEIGMAVPNGIILALIGVLVLLTPLVSEMSPDQRSMDWVAGTLLVVGGVGSLVWGLTRKS